MRFDTFQIHAELAFLLGQCHFYCSGRTCLWIHCVLSSGNTGARRTRILIPRYCLSFLDLYFHLDISALARDPAYLLFPLSNQGNVFQIAAYTGTGRCNEPSAGTALGVSAMTVPPCNYKIAKLSGLSIPLISYVVCFL